jgi:predicted lipoprotein with Yx(FWY)xxD motif
MNSLRHWAIAATLIVAGALPVSAAEQSSPTAPARAEMTDDGMVLVTPSGMTLYTYGADDSTPGKSQCTRVPVTDMPDPTAGFGKYPLPGYKYHKSCAEKWPPFMAGADAQAGGDWSLIERPEGKQWVYRGRPLYLSVKDAKPGDRNGTMTGDAFGRRGFRLAAPPLNLPPGLQLTRDADTLVLATANGRPVFTPRGTARVIPASTGSPELFHPVAAPYAAQLGGDWSVIENGTGRLQYAFKGKPLFAAPESLSNSDISEAGGWEKVVYRKLAGHPSEIGTHFSLLGDVYTDKSGRTLYVFTCTGMGCDDPGGPAGYWSALCRDGKECSRRWRPYVAAANARPVGEWSVIDVADPIFTDPTGTTYPPDAPRVKAWAYRGRPVYTYYEDKEPGDIWGSQLRWFGLSSFVALQVPGRALLD